MLERFRRKRRNRAIVEQLYDGIVARARSPLFFEAGGLPDTVMGRFDALAVEMFLFLRRCGSEPALQPLAQDVVDRFMTDMDHSMREIGIGYMTVPKRMRKLAGLFYQRVRALGGPLDRADRDGLAAALKGEKLGGGDALSDAHIAFWTAHILDTSHLYAAIDRTEILAGRWPVDPGRSGGNDG